MDVGVGVGVDVSVWSGRGEGRAKREGSQARRTLDHGVTLINITFVK